jgi:hypothetical protein
MRIKSDRPEAQQYQGRDLTFVRKVTEADGSAFTSMIDQVILKDGDRELYFYASEMDMKSASDADKKAMEKADKDAKKSADEAKEAAANNTKGKTELFKGTKQGTEKSDEQRDKDKPNAGTGGVAPMDVPAHQGANPQTVRNETSPFNRVPGEPQRTAEQDGARRTSDTGPSGYPEGSGPDPQGRRVNEKDQSHSGTVERPAPRGDQG